MACNRDVTPKNAISALTVTPGFTPANRCYLAGNTSWNVEGTRDVGYWGMPFWLISTIRIPIPKTAPKSPKVWGYASLAAPKILIEVWGYVISPFI